MAQISIIEIQSLENVGLSLNTINLNFVKLQNGVNTLEQFLNTTPIGGELEIGKIKVLIGTGSIDDIGILIENSGAINGSLSIGKNLSVIGTLSVDGVTSFNAGVSFESSATTENVLSVSQRLGINSDLVLKETPATPGEAGGTPLVMKSSVGSEGRNIVTIDISNVTTGIGANPDNSFISLESGVIGQIVKIRFDGVWTAGATKKINIENINFESNYTQNIVIDATSGDILKTSLTLFCNAAGNWTVLDAYTVDNVIIY